MKIKKDTKLKNNIEKAKINKRNNKNPIPIDGLRNLTKEGFSKAMYLYSTNFDYSKSIYSFDSKYF